MTSCTLPSPRQLLLLPLAVIAFVLVLPALAYQNSIYLRGYQGYNGYPNYPLAGAQASPLNTFTDVREQLQAAVNEVGLAGGGTVRIPADSGVWRIDKPVFVSYTNVTICGDGEGSVIAPAGTTYSTPTFYLGLRPPPEITTGHRAALTMVDDSSGTYTAYGLKTYDGTTYASGCFPGGYITDGPFVDGQGGPMWMSRWNIGKFTLDLAVQNFGSAPLTGTLCGIGASSDIANSPSTVWVLKTDGSGTPSFYFKLKDGTVKQLPFNRKLNIANQLYRIAVQVDLINGQASAWMSNDNDPTNVTKCVAADLTWTPTAAQQAFWHKSYGMFRLGDVTDSVYDAGNVGNWAYAGVEMAQGLRYDFTQNTQTKNGWEAGSPLSDRQRFMYIISTNADPANNAGIFPFAYVDFTYNPNNSLYDRPLIKAVECHGGNLALPNYGGLWLPKRAAGARIATVMDSSGNAAADGGVITLKNLTVGSPVSSGEAGSTVVIADGDAKRVIIDAVAVACGVDYPFTTLGMGYCGSAGGNARDQEAYTKGYMCEVIATNLRACTPGQWRGSAQRLNFNGERAGGGCADTHVELVGCSGRIRSLGGASIAGSYYACVASYAGQSGGPLTLEDCVIDNEGNPSFHPRAMFYLESSPRAVGGNIVTVRDLYLGMAHGMGLFELAGTAPAALYYAGGDASTYMTKSLSDRVPVNFDHSVNWIVKTSSTSWTGLVRFAMENVSKPCYWNNTVVYYTDQMVRYKRSTDAYPVTFKCLANTTANANENPESTPAKWTLVPTHKWLEYDGPAGQCKILFEHPDFDQIPQSSPLDTSNRWDGTYWEKNCHLITIPHPGGGARQYRCTQSGIIGSSTPPVFTAVN